ncbi:hypothetical protein [Paenibacillus gansuensis]|uniref:Uncharacterized protein n=1 Tax=Paenibacillus gansuensis TaxID=306542 RepID=A0ABW5PE18_9BACL
MESVAEPKRKRRKRRKGDLFIEIVGSFSAAVFFLTYAGTNSFPIGFTAMGTAFGIALSIKLAVQMLRMSAYGDPGSLMSTRWMGGSSNNIWGSSLKPRGTGQR